MSLIAVATVHVRWLPTPVQAAGHSFSNLAGLEVRWSMFSPDPNGTSVRLWAELVLSDGSIEVWEPDRDVVGGEFRYYRVVKWVEEAVILEPRGQLEELAAWLYRSDPSVESVVVFGAELVGVPPGMPRGSEIVRPLVAYDGSSFRWGGDRG